MTAKLTRTCQPSTDEPGHTSACRATFTVEGQRGNQKFLAGGLYTLQADDLRCATYLWEVTSSPPACDYLLAGSTQPQARLSLPGPGAYVVQLTVTQGNCRAQQRVILWVATPVRLYRLPATGEPLRFDGKAEWPGDLAKALLEVDHNLPTAVQKAAMEKANQPGEANPFLTRSDLSADGLTPNERDAIKAAENPSAQNPFITQSKLTSELPDGETPSEWPLGVTQPQKDALDAAENPHAGNPFVTDSRLLALAPTLDQKAALDKADSPNSKWDPLESTCRHASLSIL